jgi:hypothetical protein
MVLIWAVEARSPTRRVRTTVVSTLIPRTHRLGLTLWSDQGSSQKSQADSNELVRYRVGYAVVMVGGWSGVSNPKGVSDHHHTDHTYHCSSGQAKRGLDDVQQHTAWTLVKISRSQSFATNAVKKGKMHITVTCSDSVS